MHINNIADKFITTRLLLEQLSENDKAFIFELLNTPGWMQYIGNRNINDINDSLSYITKINANTSIKYWTVKLKENSTAIGIITFMQRDYLEHPDIGFAFLPQYSSKGYAFEAAQVVLQSLLLHFPVVLATTLRENHSSIRLLERLGLAHNREISHNEVTLQVYTTADLL